MRIRTKHSDSVVSPLAGYRLVIIIDGESIRIGAKRKLKSEMKEKVCPVIEYRRK